MPVAVSGREVRSAIRIVRSPALAETTPALRLSRLTAACAEALRSPPVSLDRRSGGHQRRRGLGGRRRAPRCLAPPEQPAWVRLAGNGGAKARRPQSTSASARPSAAAVPADRQQRRTGRHQRPVAVRPRHGLRCSVARGLAQRAAQARPPPPRWCRRSPGQARPPSPRRSRLCHDRPSIRRTAATDPPPVRRSRPSAERTLTIDLATFNSNNGRRPGHLRRSRSAADRIERSRQVRDHLPRAGPPSISGGRRIDQGHG